MFFNPFHLGSVSLFVVDGNAVITRNFVDDIGSEVGKSCGFLFW